MYAGVASLSLSCLAPLHACALPPHPVQQENRYRLLGEVVEAVKTVYPASHISVRLSPNGVYGGMGSESNYEDFQYFAGELAKVCVCVMCVHALCVRLCACLCVSAFGCQQPM